MPFLIQDSALGRTASINTGPVSTPGSSASTGTTLATSWVTAPVVGSKVIVVMCWVGANTVTSVSDNGSSVTNFTDEPVTAFFGSGGTLHTTQVWVGDNVIPAAGTYTVTATFSSGGNAATFGGGSFRNMAPGLSKFTPSPATGTSTSPSIATNPSVPPTVNGGYVWVLVDNSALNPETVSNTGGNSSWMQKNGSLGPCAGYSTLLNRHGNNTGSWTLGDSVAWSVWSGYYYPVITSALSLSQAASQASSW